MIIGLMIDHDNIYDEDDDDNKDNEDDDDKKDDDDDHPVTIHDSVEPVCYRQHCAVGKLLPADH